MADPQRKPDYRESFRDIRPNLQALEGGGETNSDRPARGNLSIVGDNNPQDTDQKKIQDAESNGTAPTKPWDVNVQGRDSLDQTRLQKVFAFGKKRGAIFGLIGLLGVGGAFVATTLGPAGMMISLMENLTSTNDSSSISFERRFLKTLGYAANGDPSCTKTSKLIGCKMGRISNSALAKLETKGLVALIDETPIDTSQKGYPDKNPTHYLIDAGDGKGAQRIPAPDLANFLSENPKAASKVLGAAGAFNLRVISWKGKYIKKTLYDKYGDGIKREGGLADGTNKSSKYSDVLAKLREKIPGLSKLTNSSAFKLSVSNKVTGHLNSAKKGGTGYVMAVASCVAVKAPGYIAAGVAAVQLAQVMPIAMDTILSPASKQKASGVDPASTFTSEDISAVGNLVTNKTLDSDGNMTAPLDSPILQSALGINQNKPAVSEAYTPGFSVLTSKLVIDANKASKDVAPFCNAVMSPAAMYTAMAVDAGVSVALSATIVGGIIKFAAGWGISTIAGEVAKSVIEDQAVAVVTDLAQNDAIPKAEGRELGDVIGISALSFFSAGGMATNLSTLKEGPQVKEFAKIKQENESFNRDMDIASLNPFDISSRYTFMGSIVYNMRMATITTGGYTGGALSVLSDAIRGPLGMSTSASAEGYSDAMCSYAGDFGLETDDPANTPAITASGLPCKGLTEAQDNMSTADAINFIKGQGWINETKTIKDNSDILELVKSGYIVADTPLADNITYCSDASTGDYLFNAAGCTVDSTVADPTAITNNIAAQAGPCDEDNAGCTSASAVDVTPGATRVVSTGTALAAISVFLRDYQSIKMMNGENETSGGSSTADTEIDQAAVYEDSTDIACAEGTDDAGDETGYRNGGAIPIHLCSIPDTTDDRHGGSPLKVNSRISGATLALIQAYLSQTGTATLRVADGFRTMAEQQEAFEYYGAGRAASPGFSNHQMGLAIDFQLGSNNGAERPGDPMYDWLAANARGFGFGKLGSESWHWQALGADNTAGSP